MHFKIISLFNASMFCHFCHRYFHLFIYLFLTRPASTIAITISRTTTYFINDSVDLVFLLF